MTYTVLIPAAGVGSRFGADCPKQYVRVAGKTVLQHTIDIFAKQAKIGQIAVIVSPNDAWVDDCVRLPENAAVYRVGGDTRAQTVFNGINHLLNMGVILPDERVLVHDAARCCLPQAALNRLLDEAGECEEGGILAIPVADTLKRSQTHSSVVYIETTVSRDNLWQAQTPQLFQAALLQKALGEADLRDITDEASAVERLGISPRLVLGDSRNIKLTRADEVNYVTWLLSQ